MGVLLGAAPFLRARPGVIAGAGNGGPKVGEGRSPGFSLEEQQQQEEKGKGEKKFSKTNAGRSGRGGGRGAQEQRGATLRSSRLSLELRAAGTERAGSGAGGGGVTVGGAWPWLGRASRRASVAR